MSETYSNGCAAGVIHSEAGHEAVLTPADWLHLAAAPTFAIMALLTAVLGGDQPDVMCSAMGHMSPLGGMVPMYGLMSAFHSPPWLKLLSGQRKS